MMIDLETLDYMRHSGDVLYERYASPVGDIYILGNDVSLKATIYKNSYPGKKSIAAIFSRGATESLGKALRILDLYFHPRDSRHKNRIVKPPERTITLKNKSLDVTIHGISLQLDLSSYTPIEIGVYRELLKIPAGSTISYGLLAQRSGIPRAARFVGSTMAKNNFPIIIPCHRVIKSDGSMGNYSGGVNIKKHLLDFEQN
jgi:O-6-methylguanine DNA methyltransferase